MKRLTGKMEILIFAAFVISAVVMVFRPIPVTRDNSIVLHTLVDNVRKGAEDNVILKLEKGEGVFYINHGLRQGLNLDSLKRQLINKQATILYLKPSFVSGFSPVANRKYVTEVRLGDRVVYSEL